MAGLASGGEALVLTPLTTTGYVSLHTGDPGDTGASEVSGGSYARQGPVAFTNTGNNPTVASNSAVVAYVTASAAYGTVSYFGLWSALSGGTFRGSGALTPSKAVNNGDTPSFAIGALTITVQ